MPRPGVTFPIVDFLADLPALATNGSCFAMDRRGFQNTNYAKIYVLVPTSATTATFWALDPGAKTITQLASPAQDANSLFGIGTAMVFDESQGMVWLFNAQATAGAATVDWAQWQHYTVSTGVWASHDTSTLNLGAPWGSTGGEAALCHTDSQIAVDTILGATADQYIYLIGNAAVTMYRYNGAAGGADTWATLPGGGAARAAAPGAGSCLLWNGYNTNQLHSFRGGGSTLVDINLISTDTWAAGVATTPAIAATTGFEAVSTYGFTERSIVAQNGQIYLYNMRTGGLLDAAHIDGVDGAAHSGKSMVYYEVGGKPYIVIRPHSGTAVQRIRLIY